MKYGCHTCNKVVLHLEGEVYKENGRIGTGLKGGRWWHKEFGGVGGMGNAINLLVHYAPVTVAAIPSSPR
jgi:hypothetical protein